MLVVLWPMGGAGRLSRVETIFYLRFSFPSFLLLLPAGLLSDKGASHRQLNSTQKCEEIKKK